MDFLGSFMLRAVAPLTCAIALSGCANWKQVAHADGPLDLAMALVGKAKPDVAPIERISHGGGAIATARAVAYDGGVLVRGSVRKASFGWGTTSYSHVDVVVLDAKRRVLGGIATKYFPSEIPNTSRGEEGRSRFSVRLSRALPPGATIQVVFHNSPVRQCEFYWQNGVNG
jgi:hypothetical protein